MPSNPSVEPATAPPPHLSPVHWTAAGRTLLARTIAEMAYEEMVTPQPDGPPESWRIDLPDGVSYAFLARRGAFGAWRVRPASLLRRVGDQESPATDPTRFVVDAAAVLGLSRAVLADLIRDLTATHAADARLHANAIPARDLADLSHEDLEAHQTGHPCMFLNKGRLGFSAADTARYTPEAADDFRLVWLAVAPELARFTAVPGLDRHALLADELDPDTRTGFAGRVRDRGGDPEAYVWLPVHPFQWDEVVLPLFAAQIADGSVVHLGESADRYRPLQSIRTLTNLDRPGRRNVKVPLMIRNTLVWRGLSEAQTTCAPRLTTWLRELRDGDGFLRDECRVAMLGEVASVTVPHPTYQALPDAPYRYQELLGAIWREPVHGSPGAGGAGPDHGDPAAGGQRRPGGGGRAGRTLRPDRAGVAARVPRRAAAAAAALPVPLRRVLHPARGECGADQ